MLRDVDAFCAYRPARKRGGAAKEADYDIYMERAFLLRRASAGAFVDVAEGECCWFAAVTRCADAAMRAARRFALPAP